MKVVAIQGSPRRGGNTEIVLEAVLAGLADATQPNLTMIRAAEKGIAGCRECFACQSVPDAPGCANHDDMVGVYEAVMEADLVILASPVFCWGFTSQLKRVLDRLYACFKFDKTPPRCLLAGKKLALVVTSGGGPNDGADVCERVYDSLIQFGQAVDRGRLVCTLTKNPTATRHDGALLERARAFGKALA
jgi:multimeric flavodoxin WrbA